MAVGGSAGVPRCGGKTVPHYHRAIGSSAASGHRTRSMTGISMRNRKQTKTKNERKGMNDKFDELAKAMAQSVTRRGALKKFGLGLAGIALAALGLANKASADPKPPICGVHCKCHQPDFGC